jgi:hypothetical protein
VTGAHLSAQTAKHMAEEHNQVQTGVYAIGVLSGRKQRPEVMTCCYALHTLIMMKLAMLILASFEPASCLEGVAHVRCEASA